MIKECKICHLPDNIALAGEIFICTKKNSHEFPFQEIIGINENGICNKCLEYQEKFQENFLKKQVEAFVSVAKNDQNSIVAYSGGKDSTIALYLAKKVLGLNVTAYMLDNGFIPEDVQNRAKIICNFLEIPLITVQDDIYKEFLTHYKFDSQNKKWSSTSEKDLCSTCSKKIFNNLTKIISKSQTKTVITGLNTYVKIRRFRISAIGRINYESDNERKFYSHLALPYAMRISLSEQDKILGQIPWHEIKLDGYTSNCLIPGFTEKFFSEESDYSFDLPYLAKEKRSGYFNNSEQIFLNLKNKHTLKDEDHAKITEFFTKKGLL